MSWSHDRSANERGYGHAWRKRRASILRRDARLCQPCKRMGRLTPDCSEVDHIVPKAQGGTDRPSNLQTICSECHRAKTTAENGGRVRHGCDVDGMPAAPGHPWAPHDPSRR